MTKAKPDTPEPTNGVERRPRKARSREGGGSGTVIPPPTREQLERRLIGRYETAVQYELRRNVKARFGNTIQELPVIEAVIRLISDAALTGDFLAQRELLALYRDERNTAIKSKQRQYRLDSLSEDELLELNRLFGKIRPDDS